MIPPPETLLARAKCFDGTEVDAMIAGFLARLALESHLQQKFGLDKKHYRKGRGFTRMRKTLSNTEVNRAQTLIRRGHKRVHGEDVEETQDLVRDIEAFIEAHPL